MRIVHLSFSDSKGGAAIGAWRLHSAMRESGLDSHMLVIHRGRNENVIHPLLDKHTRKTHLESVNFSKRLKSIYNIGDLPIRSFNLKGTNTAHAINSLNPDIVQMHWIGLNTIRIDDIKNIKAPVFWKMADMWAFSGAEHYTNADEPQRHREGYDIVPCFRGEAADLDRLVWEYKKTHYPDIPSLTMISPSRFLAHEAHKSVLLGNRNCHVIPNPLPSEWLELEPASKDEKNRLREQFGIFGKELVIFFGAYQTTEKRKGFHHIESMVKQHLPDIIGTNQLAFIVAGGEKRISTCIYGYDIQIFPTTSDFHKYSSYLRACDLIMLPSEMENSAMVIQEALACGIPAITFDIGGMPDLVHHKKSGFLAAPYKSKELADGIRWWLECTDREFVMMYSKNLARSAHDSRRCAARYVRLYQNTLEKSRTGRATGKSLLFDHDPENLIVDEAVRFLIIAPTIEDWTSGGEVAESSLNTYKAAARIGFKPIILASRDCITCPNIEINPVFESLNNFESSSQYAIHLYEVMHKISDTHELRSHDAFFFPHLDLHQADAVLRLLLAHDHPDFPGFHLCIPESDTTTTPEAGLQEGFFRSLSNSGYVNRRIFIYSASEILLKEISQLPVNTVTDIVKDNSGNLLKENTNSPLLLAVSKQGLTKTETVLYVSGKSELPDALKWLRNRRTKIIHADIMGTHLKVDDIHYPQPGDSHIIKISLPPIQENGWRLPKMLVKMTKDGKLRHVIYGEDIDILIKKAFDKEFSRILGEQYYPIVKNGTLFIDAKLYIANRPAQTPKVIATGRPGLVRRLPRAVLRRTRNLFRRLNG